MIRTMLPLVLMAVVLGGCVYIPGPEVSKRTFGTGPDVNPKQLLGDANSSKPIRPGVMRDAVRATLGPPDRANTDGTLEEYEYYTHLGWLIGVIPLDYFWGDQSYAMADNIHLLIRFDQQGRVLSSKIAKGTRSQEPGLHELGKSASNPPERGPESHQPAR